MSELQKAKQRLLLRSSSIAETPEQDNQFKVFTKTVNGGSIPKLHANNSYLRVNNKQRSVSELEFADPDRDYEDIYLKAPSPGFAKTQRHPNYFKSERSDTQSEQAQNINFVQKRNSKNRRVTQYSRVSGNYQPQEYSEFTQNQKSVYNESPQKVVKNTVHGDKLDIIIAKMPIRRSISPFKPKQCMIEIVENQFKQNRSNNKLFIDEMFPPRFTIIFNKKYMYLEEGLKLERLPKIYQGSQVRFIKYCEPSLMVAGKFTSPALYSALAILCEEPTRVFNILGNQQYNQNGAYYVQLCKDGVWRYVTVDDYLPVKITTKRKLLFLHALPRNNIIEFWPSIVEKALAKIYGTYQDIFLTSFKGIKDLFRNLTGYPVSQYRINKDFRTFLIVIDAAIKKKQIVVLQQITEQYEQTGHLKGLQPHFSYQIIEVKKSYIVLRNLAQKQLITKLTFEEAMIFSRLLIFRSESNYIYISRNLRHKKKCYSIVKVTIKSPIKCYWDIWENCQVYYKNHIGSHIDYKKSLYVIKIRKQVASEQNNYDSEPQEEIQLESGKEVTMTTGIYHVMIHLCQQKQQDFVLSYYGEQDVEIERVKNMSKWEDECQC